MSVKDQPSQKSPSLGQNVAAVVLYLLLFSVLLFAGLMFFLAFAA